MLGESVQVSLGGLMRPRLRMEHVADDGTTSVFRCGTLSLCFPNELMSSHDRICLTLKETENFFALNRIDVMFSDRTPRSARLTHLTSYAFDLTVGFITDRTDDYRQRPEQRFHISRDAFQRDMENGCLDLSDVDDIFMEAYDDSERIKLAQRVYDELIVPNHNKVNQTYRYNLDRRKTSAPTQSELLVHWVCDEKDFWTTATVTDIRCPAGKQFVVMSLEEVSTEMQFQLLLSTSQLRCLLVHESGQEWFNFKLTLHEAIPPQLKNVMVPRLNSFSDGGDWSR